MSDGKIDQQSLDVEISVLENEVAADPSIQAADQQLQTAGDQRVENVQEWKTIIGILLGAGFGIVAPNWNVQKSEVDALSDAYAPLLDKYFPDISLMGAEIAAVLTTAAIIVPRLGMDRKIEDRDEVPSEAPAKTKKVKPKPKPKPKAAGLPSEEDR